MQSADVATPRESAAPIAALYTTLKSCAATGCSNTRLIARGMCCKHYNRFRKYGDPLSGGTERGAANEFLQNEVLNYRGDNCLFWPFARDNHGYGRIRRPGKGMSIVSRVVCEAINGSPPDENYDAAHNCGNGARGCVSPMHIRWATRSENCMDKYEHGTLLRGNANPSAKLTAHDVSKIRGLLGTKSQNRIAAMFCVSQQAISKINTGKCWREEQ